eukprot:TRINITY_DN1960_c0_g1_i1.p1 TRINITY_DN1960_c0_g1~~TRINITY_DN1960_c0_g1_i1.p1  ORF type:complete len:138 (-),score=15.01 TRINITY_DN1960_c0_g1_i1:494-907(-)
MSQQQNSEVSQSQNQHQWDPRFIWSAIYERARKEGNTPSDARYLTQFGNSVLNDCFLRCISTTEAMLRKTPTLTTEEHKCLINCTAKHFNSAQRLTVRLDEERKGLLVSFEQLEKELKAGVAAELKERQQNQQSPSL